MKFNSIFWLAKQRLSFNVWANTNSLHFHRNFGFARSRHVYCYRGKLNKKAYAALKRICSRKAKERERRHLFFGSSWAKGTIQRKRARVFGSRVQMQRARFFLGKIEPSVIVKIIEAGNLMWLLEFWQEAASTPRLNEIIGTAQRFYCWMNASEKRVGCQWVSVSHLSSGLSRYSWLAELSKINDWSRDSRQLSSISMHTSVQKLNDTSQVWLLLHKFRNSLTCSPVCWGCHRARSSMSSRLAMLWFIRVPLYFYRKSRRDIQFPEHSIRKLDHKIHCK